MANGAGSDAASNSSSSSSSSTDDPLTSWFSSIKSFFEDNADEQRMERLEQCRVLEHIMTECRKTKKKSKLEGSDRVHLEDLPPGIRMVRYFDWRNVHDYDRKCSREAHAVWACRASALQCGSELVQVRNCFNDLQRPLPDNPNVKNYGAVLGCSATAYETKKKNAEKEIPCRAFQEQVGLCIAKNATALAEREVFRAKEAKKKEAQESKTTESS